MDGSTPAEAAVSRASKNVASIVAVAIVHCKQRGGEGECDCGEGVFGGIHREGPFAGRLGIPSAELIGSDRPKLVAARLLSSSTLGLLGTPSCVLRDMLHTHRGLRIGNVLLYIVQLKAPHSNLVPSLNGVLEHVSGAFAVSYDHGESSLLRCPSGLLPWRRTQWITLGQGVESSVLAKFDPHTLAISRWWNGNASGVDHGG